MVKMGVGWGGPDILPYHKLSFCEEKRIYVGLFPIIFKTKKHVIRFFILGHCFVDISIHFRLCHIWHDWLWQDWVLNKSYNTKQIDEQFSYLIFTYLNFLCTVLRYLILPVPVVLLLLAFSLHSTKYLVSRNRISMTKSVTKIFKVYVSISYRI